MNLEFCQVLFLNNLLDSDSAFQLCSPAMSDLTSDFVSVPEFADRFKLTVAAVYAAIQDNRVQHTRIFGRIAIPATELKRFEKRKNGKQSKVLKAA